MREPQHDKRRQPAESLPPLWIRGSDSQGRLIDARVVALSERLWPWAYRHVERQLHDAAGAAQVVEQVALEVSNRLHDKPGVDRNLAGYFITAFHRQVRQQLRKENRVTYEGLLRELEQNHHLTAPDWGEELERKLCLNALVEQLPQQSRHMLHFRILGYSWKEIGRMLRISGKQARSRFYYDLNKAHTRLHGSGTNGAGHSEEPE